MTTHDNVMQYGKFQGYLMKDIPRDYLLYVYENKKCDWSIRRYIELNYDEILKRK